jgi:hypothetical protein
MFAVPALDFVFCPMRLEAIPDVVGVEQMHHAGLYFSHRSFHTSPLRGWDAGAGRRLGGRAQAGNRAGHEALTGRGGSPKHPPLPRQAGSTTHAP